MLGPTILSKTWQWSRGCVHYFFLPMWPFISKPLSIIARQNAPVYVSWSQTAFHGLWVSILARQNSMSMQQFLKISSIGWGVHNECPDWQRTTVKSYVSVWLITLSFISACGGQFSIALTSAFILVLKVKDQFKSFSNIFCFKTQLNEMLDGKFIGHYPLFF